MKIFIFYIVYILPRIEFFCQFWISFFKIVHFSLWIDYRFANLKTTQKLALFDQIWIYYYLKNVHTAKIRHLISSHCNDFNLKVRRNKFAYCYEPKYIFPVVFVCVFSIRAANVLFTCRECRYLDYFYYGTYSDR